MGLRIKKGVRVRGLSNEAMIGIHLAESVFERHSHDCIITSITDGTHSKNSRHYIGMAFDLRRRHLDSDKQANEILKELISELGSEYLIILEKTHYHIQYNG